MYAAYIAIAAMSVATAAHIFAAFECDRALRAMRLASSELKLASDAIRLASAAIALAFDAIVLVSSEIDKALREIDRVSSSRSAVASVSLEASHV